MPHGMVLIMALPTMVQIPMESGSPPLASAGVIAMQVRSTASEASAIIGRRRRTARAAGRACTSIPAAGAAAAAAGPMASVCAPSQNKIRALKYCSPSIQKMGSINTPLKSRI